MKNRILTFVVICIFAMVTFKDVNAQIMRNSNGVSDAKYLEISVSFGAATLINAGSETINTINTRVVRDFVKNYRDVFDEKWYKVSNGYIAKFVRNGLENMAAYNTSGHWMFTIIYYDEKKLPPEVRAIVKSTYYDYSITRVDEIHVNSQIIYQVHMQDENTWKNIRVCDGSIEVVEDYSEQPIHANR